MVPCYLLKFSISSLSKLLWSLPKNSLKDLPNQLPITPGETMDPPLMGIISKLQIRTFLLCWVVGHFNFALTIRQLKMRLRRDGVFAALTTGNLKPGGTSCPTGGLRPVLGIVSRSVPQGPPVLGRTAQQFTGHCVFPEKIFLSCTPVRYNNGCIFTGI